MKWELKTALAVHTYDVVAELRSWEPRPEIAALLEAAQGSADGRIGDVVDGVLPGLSERARRNLVAALAQLGLVDRDGRVLAAGERAAETGQVPIPEEGLYRLHVVAHPVCGRRLLHVERLESASERADAPVAVPVTPPLGLPQTSVVQPDAVMEVVALPTADGERPVCVERPSAGTCTLRWRFDGEAGNAWTLEGQIELPDPVRRGVRAQHPFATAPASIPEVAPSALLAEWVRTHDRDGRRWDAADERLLTPLSPVGPDERRAFRATLHFDQVEVPARGTYRAVTIHDVPLAPDGPETAQAWAMALWRERLGAADGCWSREMARAAFQAVVADTPLAARRPILAAHEELVATEEDVERRWRLAAGVDLAPAAVPARMRGAMRVGPVRRGTAPPTVTGAATAAEGRTA